MTETIHTIEDGRLTHIEVDSPSKVDGHCHSKYSGIKPNLFIGSWWTRATGVRESYTHPKKAYKTAKEKGMSFPALSDHDSVFGALEMRRFSPEDTLVNCEYTVKISDTQAIHVGVWGVDYPGDEHTPLTDEQVLELHSELIHYANEGHERFIDFCNDSGIRYCWNHPASQEDKHNPITGAQLNDISDMFSILEINGDYQGENVLALRIAEEKNKLICAGSDAHPYLRIGNHFTATRYPTDSPYEFLQAFKKGDIGIGSKHPIPPNASIEELVEHGFNGTVGDLWKDTMQGHIDYILRDWGPRKFLTGAAVLGLPWLAAAAPQPWMAWLSLPLAYVGEAVSAHVIARAIVIMQKWSSASRTKKLYREYQHVKFLEATNDKRGELGKLKRDLSSLERDIEKVERNYMSRTLPKLFKLPKPSDHHILQMGQRVGWFDTDYSTSGGLKKLPEPDDPEESS